MASSASLSIAEVASTSPSSAPLTADEADAAFTKVDVLEPRKRAAVQPPADEPPQKKRNISILGGDDEDDGDNDGCASCDLLLKAWDVVEDLEGLYKEGGLAQDFRILWGEESLVDYAFGHVLSLSATQEGFAAAGKESLVDIAYHYTNEANLSMIRQHGLQTRSQRSAKGINAVKNNGAVFGDGVYLGKNPFAYKHFGDVCLLVARVCGTESNRRGVWDANAEDSRTHRTGFDEISLLRTSAQCVPLVAFNASLLDPKDDLATGNAKVFSVHLCLQDLLDKHFNDKVPTPVERVWPSAVFKARQQKCGPLPEISLQAVREKILQENGRIHMRRLLRLFKLNRFSSHERQDKFRKVAKELCQLEMDKKGGRFLKLKQQWSADKQSSTVKHSITSVSPKVRERLEGLSKERKMDREFYKNRRTAAGAGILNDNIASQQRSWNETKSSLFAKVAV